MKRLWKLKRIFILLLIPLSILLTYLAKKSSFFAEEIYAKHIYRFISMIYSNITGILPFSLGELIIVTAPIFVTILVVRFIIKLVSCNSKKNNATNDTRGYIAGKGILNVLCFASIIFFIYVIGCRLNYYRYSIATYCDLTVVDSTEDELFELCSSLTAKANELRSQIDSEDMHGALKLSKSKKQISKDLLLAYDEIANQYSILGGYYSGTKPILFSRMMSRMNLTGIFFPFTMEANVNIDIPEYSIPSTMAHEMAHVRGFMREDEANYIAYLVCMSSDNVEIQYSGTLEALILAGNALYDKNVERYREISATYSNQVRIDLNANSEYWRQFANKTISNVAEQINDSYLKFNDQEDGTQSYGRMVDLLLAQYRASKQ